jgi:hypothetical protein
MPVDILPVVSMAISMSTAVGGGVEPPAATPIVMDVDAVAPATTVTAAVPGVTAALATEVNPPITPMIVHKLSKRARFRDLSMSLRPRS